jgi:hypothetical protein
MHEHLRKKEGSQLGTTNEFKLITLKVKRMQ